ncbi:MAG TPA: WD40 repeat domain-containing serine/threonine protein kinase [Kofleriaceae bacterium]|nr:WD40 repeat domain-containing serine/threonine protein kinase [Kofleriaceae bacterium]
MKLATGSAEPLAGGERPAQLDLPYDRTQTASPSEAAPAGSGSGSGSPATPAPERSAATQVRDADRYCLIGEHGRGGLGRVLRAHDRDLGRDVAIKELISRDHISELRFFRESLITARLEHPGIVPVYEAGRWHDGTPFYAMKLVAGRPLRDLIAERTTVEDRIGLLHHVIAVADAIAYAHGRNIIHRDLKPANVIIGDFGETIVIDWGLAKDLTGPDDPGGGATPSPHRDSDLTSAGSVLGTPAYMAPEQQRGEPVDQRADVFAIGAMLWELCALQREPPAGSPQRRRMLRGAGIDDDLVAIIDKALAPEPRSRYPDAGALAADLKAFKSGARITARSYSLLAMLGHWTRRHRTLALSALAFSVLLIGSVVALGVLYRSSSQNAAAARDRLVLSYLEQGRRLSLDGEYLRALPYLAEAYAQGDRSNAVRLLLARAERFAGLTLGVYSHPARARAAAFRPDGRHVLSVSDDGDAAIWDAATGRVDAVLPRTARPPPHPGAEAMLSSRISRDGAFVAVPLPEAIQVWDGVQTRSIGPPHAERLGIDASGGRLAVAVHGELSAWQVATGARLWTVSLPAAMSHIAWCGDVVVALGVDQIVRVVDGQAVIELATRGPVDKIAVGENAGIATVSGVVVELWQPGGVRRSEVRGLSPVTAVAFSPDATRIAVAGDNGILRLHDATSGAALGEFVGHRGGISSIEFTADGARLATAGYDLTVRMWDVADHRQITSLRGARDLPIVTALRIDGAGDRVLIPTADGAVYVFSVADPDVELSVDAGEAITSATFSADGQRFATGTAHAARIWSAATGQEIARFDASDTYLVLLSPDGSKLAVVDSAYKHVEVQDRITRKQLARLSCPGIMYLAAFDHAGARLATGCDNEVEVLDLRDQRVARLAGHQDLLGAIAFSPDDRWLLSGANDHTSRIWDLASNRELARLTTSGTTASVAFDVTGMRVVTGTSDRIARIWDVATQRIVRSFEHSSAVESAAINAGGSLLAAGTRDGAVAIWDTATSDLVAELHHPARVNWVAFSPDGRHLLSAGDAHRAIVSRIELETRSPDIVAAFVRCHAPYRLNQTRLESATPSCDRP